MPEILSPAGTFDALKAAVNAGCDAVYMGGDLFSARAYAGNFGKEEMVRAIDYCHLFGVKAYMTVNILLKESEIHVLREYMQPYYEAGLDGVIVQDPGVFRVLKENFPDMALHARFKLALCVWMLRGCHCSAADADDLPVLLQFFQVPVDCHGTDIRNKLTDLLYGDHLFLKDKIPNGFPADLIHSVSLHKFKEVHKFHVKEYRILLHFEQSIT